MNLTDLILAATPLGLVGVGAVLFFFGWLLGGPESRVFYSVVVATALAALRPSRDPISDKANDQPTARQVEGALADTRALPPK